MTQHQTKITVKHQLLQRENDVRCSYILRRVHGQKILSATRWMKQASECVLTVKT